MSTRLFLGLLLIGLSPVVSQSQTFTVLKNGSGVDGHGFAGGLLLGSDGKVFGTAFDGGANGVGTFYSLSPNGTGFTSLRDFAVATGSRPAAGLIEGSNGLLYGITSAGGTPANTSGVIYSVNKNGTGYTVLREFAATGFEGADGQGRSCKAATASSTESPVKEAPPAVASSSGSMRTEAASFP